MYFKKNSTYMLHVFCLLIITKRYTFVLFYEMSRYPGTVHENGIDILCSTIIDSPESLTLIAIGPLGNVAEALKRNPNITKNSRFVGMHGSIHIGYRGSNSPDQEFNVKRNIAACRERRR